METPDQRFAGSLDRILDKAAVACLLWLNTMQGLDAMHSTVAPGTKFTDELVGLVDGIEFDALPAEAIRVAKSGLLDATGVALAGWEEACSEIVFRHACAVYAGGSASVIGSDTRLAPMGAALANGTLAHALDFDDTAWSYIGHPSAVLLAAGLALGEPGRSSGRDLIAAYVAGFEVSHRVGRRVVESPTARGWHPTSAVGIFGAAAAAGKLLGDRRQTLARAFGLAATQAAGLRANFGWMAKPFHAGMAARGGVEAALLADAGLTASSSVFEDPLGFFQTFADREAEADGNGELAIVADGIAFKRYPSCTGSHPAVDAALELSREHDIRAEDVESIRCGTTPEVTAELVHPSPTEASQARFSMNFAVAVALVEGALELEHFSAEMLSREPVRDLMARCETVVDPGLVRPAGVRAPSGVVEIRLAGGKTVSKRVDSAKGNPANPLSTEELVEKFEICAARRLTDAARVGELRDALLNLEEMPDVAEIAAMTRPR